LGRTARLNPQRYHASDRNGRNNQLPRLQECKCPLKDGGMASPFMAL
jgi:hypothetical protein